MMQRGQGDGEQGMSSDQSAGTAHDEFSAEGQYQTEERATVAEAPGLRVRRLGLAAGQCVPWHHHTLISDHFFCMEGPMEIRLRGPTSVKRLAPGEAFEVPPGRQHYVSGVDGRACRFMIVQGVGTYDYVEGEAE